MNNDNLEITALIGSFDGTELEGIEPLREGEDFFFPAIESAKRLGYHNPRDAIRRHCKREAKTVDEIVITGKRKDGSDAVQVIHRKYVCEADFYRLLFHSRTPIGMRFADWLMDEVLPSIREHGYYYSRKFERVTHAYLDMMDHKEQYSADEQDMIHREFFGEVGKMTERIKGGNTPTS